MTDDAPSPLESIRRDLYRTLRGATAARGDPAMAALALEVGILVEDDEGWAMVVACGFGCIHHEEANPGA